MLRPLSYSKFQLYRIEPSDVENAPLNPYPFSQDATFRIVSVINQPATQVVFEDWFKGQVYQWHAWTDGVHVVLQGKAEITLWHPPDLEQTTVAIVEAPCVYLLPFATRAQWRVLSDEPFRKLAIDFPNPGFGSIAQPV